MFGTASGTPYDLRFSLFGIPVAVTPFFWAMAALLGWERFMTGRDPNGPVHLMIWVLCVFVSILVHEFGHAFSAKAFGHEPNVLLYHFGGLAFYGERETPGKAFLITAAGPAIQLVMAAMFFGLLYWLGETGRLMALGPQVRFAILTMIEINVFWALFNLLPVFPLDGGRLLHELLEIIRVPRALDWALRVGVLVGTVVAVWGLLNGNMYLGIMFALLTIQNYQTLQGLNYRPW